MDLAKDKGVLSEADFPNLDFHDVRIYGIEFLKEEFSIVFDIDYIFEWKLNEKTNLFDEYKVASALLRFDNYTDLEINMSQMNTYDIIIDSISQGEIIPSSNNTYSKVRYDVKLNVGRITFMSTGLKMKLTSEIISWNEQEFGLYNRGKFKI